MEKQEMAKFLKDEIVETMDLIEPLVKQEEDIISTADGDWGFEYLQEKLDDLKSGAQEMQDLLMKIHTLSEGFDKYDLWKDEAEFGLEIKRRVTDFSRRRSASVGRYADLQKKGMKSREQ